MANSSYYYNLYKQEKAKAKEYAKNISSLRKILDTLSGSFYDEQRNVNAELDDLKEDLNKAVRHDSNFNIAASDCYVYKELAVTSDTSLNGAVNAIENELSSLNAQKTTAEQNSTAYYKAYQDAKNEEKQQYLQYLQSLLNQGGN